MRAVMLPKHLGATVIEVRGDIVLAKLEDNKVTPYATWNLSGEGRVFWGHYCSDLESAVEDFIDRSR